ncbi:MAG: methyl-accepting chemotaxis protein [Solirubrobacteraceae bacterium]|nr:methyl-accepting chemotaxis protein [Solirubrobacteraceae bacterium]
MSRLRPTSIRAKLLGSSAILLLFALIIGVASVNNLSSVAEKADKANRVATAPLADLVTAGVAFNLNRALTFQHIMSPSVQEKKQLEQQIAKNSAGADAALAEVGASLILPAGKQQFAALKTDLTEVRAARKRVLTLSRTGRDQEARALMTAKVVPGLDRVNATFEKLLTTKRNLGETTSADIASAYKSSRTLTIVLLIIAIIVGAAMSLLLSRSISGNVGQVLRAAEGIAEGDLDQQVTVKSRDEIGTMAKAFTRMVEYLKDVASSADRVAAGDLTSEVQPKSDRDVLGTAIQAMTISLRDTVGQVQDTAETLSSASQQMATTSEETGRAVGEIAHAVGEVAEGAQRQVTAVESAREISDRVVQATEDSTRNAAETAEAAAQARSVAQDGADAADQASQAMEAVRVSTEDVTTAIRGLGAKSEQIGGIVGTITGIAEQTNLLALNAAIEAARAGEQGRGFAVVADEVRKLAEESQSAAEQISQLIGQIQDETQRTVAAAEIGAERTAEGATTVDQARTQFALIGESVDDVTARIETIASAIGEIASSAQKMQTDMNEVAAVAEESSASTEQVSASTQQTSASTEQIAASAQELAASASELTTLVQRFQLH